MEIILSPPPNERLSSGLKHVLSFWIIQTETNFNPALQGIPEPLRWSPAVHHHHLKRSPMGLIFTPRKFWYCHASLMTRHLYPVGLESEQYWFCTRQDTFCLPAVQLVCIEGCVSERVHLLGYFKGAGGWWVSSFFVVYLQALCDFNFK